MAAGHQAGRVRPVRAGRRERRWLRSTIASFPMRKQAGREDAARVSSPKNRAEHPRSADPLQTRAWTQIRGRGEPKRLPVLWFHVSLGIPASNVRARDAH